MVRSLEIWTLISLLLQNTQVAHIQQPIPEPNFLTTPIIEKGSEPSLAYRVDARLFRKDNSLAEGLPPEKKDFIFGVERSYPVETNRHLDVEPHSYPEPCRTCPSNPYPVLDTLIQTRKEKGNRVMRMLLSMIMTEMQKSQRMSMSL